jgi:hypothetical protein
MRLLMDARRTIVLFGTMVVSLAGLSRVIVSIYRMDMDWKMTVATTGACT